MSRIRSWRTDSGHTRGRGSGHARVWRAEWVADLATLAGRPGERGRSGSRIWPRSRVEGGARAERVADLATLACGGRSEGGAGRGSGHARRAAGGAGGSEGGAGRGSGHARVWRAERGRSGSRIWPRSRVEGGARPGRVADLATLVCGGRSGSRIWPRSPAGRGSEGGAGRGSGHARVWRAERGRSGSRIWPRSPTGAGGVADRGGGSRRVAGRVREGGRGSGSCGAGAPEGEGARRGAARSTGNPRDSSPRRAIDHDPGQTQARLRPGYADGRAGDTPAQCARVRLIPPRIPATDAEEGTPTHGQAAGVRAAHDRGAGHPLRPALVHGRPGVAEVRRRGAGRARGRVRRGHRLRRLRHRGPGAGLRGRHARPAGSQHLRRPAVARREPRDRADVLRRPHARRRADPERPPPRAQACPQPGGPARPDVLHAPGDRVLPAQGAARRRARTPSPSTAPATSTTSRGGRRTTSGGPPSRCSRAWASASSSATTRADPGRTRSTCGTPTP